MNFEVNDINLLNKIIKITYDDIYIYEDPNHLITVIEYLELTQIEFYTLDLDDVKEFVIEKYIIKSENRLLYNKMDNNQDIYFKNRFYFIKLIPNIILTNLKYYVTIYPNYKIKITIKFKEWDDTFNTDNLKMKIISVKN